MANLSTLTLPEPALYPGNHTQSCHGGMSHICRPVLSEVFSGILPSYTAGSVDSVYKVIFTYFIEK